jgi:hypothetical protein
MSLKKTISFVLQIITSSQNPNQNPLLANQGCLSEGDEASTARFGDIGIHFW